MLSHEYYEGYMATTVLNPEDCSYASAVSSESIDEQMHASIDKQQNRSCMLNRVTITIIFYGVHVLMLLFPQAVTSLFGHLLQGQLIALYDSQNSLISNYGYVTNITVHHGLIGDATAYNNLCSCPVIPSLDATWCSINNSHYLSTTWCSFNNRDLSISIWLLC